MGRAARAAGCTAATPKERELLWATAMLHDIGIAVDYDDHHKHSRYLILNAGLPGFTPRETALIGQAARYHRKGTPCLGEFAPEIAPRRRGAARPHRGLRPDAEQLERSRDQSVHALRVAVHDGTAELRLQAAGDVRSPAGPPSVRATCSSAPSHRDLTVT